MAAASTFQPAENLKSRTFVGLLLSQFLAAFNDHASQIVAIFYASDMLVRFVGLPGVDEKLLVSIVTACFITPFFFFSPLAGVLADKYSKRNIIVFWKVAEVAIMAVALVGFALPHFATETGPSQQFLATWSAWLLVLTVFLMGTHSAFFVPAKYGIMPEILHPMVLSRGNGLLEGTSFVAQILGTAFGGFMYGLLKSSVSEGTLLTGQEWIIGLVLFVLALIGTLASLLVARVPAAAPDRPLVWSPWVPLRASFAILRDSRSLVLATVGIAFFLFMTLFLRQTLLFEGEAVKELQHAQQMLRDTGRSVEVAEPDHTLDLESIGPAESGAQQAEFRVAMLIALVGLGVGIGCSLAGYFSGSRLELGLVPIGATLLVLLTAALAWVVSTDLYTLICLLFIGMSAGLYIVPLYTLLQHRAPKESKGSLVALSNFLNVAGGLVAVAVFYFVTFALQASLSITMSGAEVQADRSLLPAYVEQLEMQMNIPRILFLFASLITLGMLVMLCRQRPDFVVRAVTWILSMGRRHLQASGLENVPGKGPLILATNCQQVDQMLSVASVTDRYSHFVLVRPTGGGYATRLAGTTGSIIVGNGSQRPDWERLERSALAALNAGHVVGLVVTGGPDDLEARFFNELRQRFPAPVLPVHCKIDGAKQRVTIGKPLPAGASLLEAIPAIEALGS